MRFFRKPHWHFAESRLTWLEGAESAPPPQEAEKSAPTEKPTEKTKPDIEEPPTENAEETFDKKLKEAAGRSWEGKNVEDPQVFEQALQQLMQDFKAESQGQETGRGIMYDLNTLFVYCPEDQKDTVVQRVLKMNSDWNEQGLEIKYNGQFFHFDNVTKQPNATNAESGDEGRGAEAQGEGLSERDRSNREVSRKNIDISLYNLDFYREAKEDLQGRLQSWAELSVSKFVDIADDRLSATQGRINRNMERQVRVIRDLTHSINNLDKKIIRYIDEKAQLDPSDERHKQLTRLIGETIREANIASQGKRKEGDRLMDTFDETDIALDEKKGTYTETYADEEFDANDEAILKQFEEGFDSKSISRNLIEALRSMKPIIGLFGSTKTVNLDMATKKAQEVYQQMKPEQRRVFEKWLNTEIADAGLQQKIEFDGSGKLKIES